eukprot:c1061_g1_i1 orf=467-754(+)
MVIWAFFSSSVFFIYGLLVSAYMIDKHLCVRFSDFSISGWRVFCNWQLSHEMATFLQLSNFSVNGDFSMTNHFSINGNFSVTSNFCMYWQLLCMK